MAESNGHFDTLNTYDAARFSFSLLYWAAHAPNDHFTLLLRDLLQLPNAKAYFPDLALKEDFIYQHTQEYDVPLETQATTEPLMRYLNPTPEEVTVQELVNSAKFIHWSQNDPLHRDLQVDFAIRSVKKNLSQYNRLYKLDGVSDKACIVIADIRHHGRARSREIIEALDSNDPYTNLLKIRRDRFNERIDTLQSAIEMLEKDGKLGINHYDAAKGIFVPK